MFESLNDKNQLIASVQKFFARQKGVQQLGISGGPFANQQNLSVKPVQKGFIAKAPAINFIDTRSRGNNGSNVTVTTQQGAAVPSVDLHRMILASAFMDMQKRLELNNEIDKIIYTCTEAYQTEKELIDLAFGPKGYTTKVEPSEAIKKLVKVNPQLVKRAEKMAATVDPLWEQLEDKQTKRKKKARARAYLRYGNVPIELIDSPSGIVNYRGQPPHAMQINVDEDLKFKDRQLDAYIKYDAFNLAKVLGKWPEALIVWCGNFELEWLVYGISPMLSGLACYRSLVMGSNFLRDGRGWSVPKIFRVYGDLANNPVDPNNLTEAQYNTREEKVKRGESIHGFEEEIINGFLKDIKLVSGSTDYFSKLDDFKMFGSNGAALFGMNMARRRNPETITRSTMDRIDEYVHENAETFLGDLTEATDDEVFKAYTQSINRAIAGERKVLDISRNEDLIDHRLIQLKVYSSSPTTAERMNQRANTAIQGFKAGLIPPELAVEPICQALGIDTEKCLLLMEKEKQLTAADKQANKAFSNDLNKLNTADEDGQDFVGQIEAFGQQELNGYLQ